MPPLEAVIHHRAKRLEPIDQLTQVLPVGKGRTEATYDEGENAWEISQARYRQEVVIVYLPVGASLSKVQLKNRGIEGIDSLYHREENNKPF